MNYEIEQTKHTKTEQDIWVVRFNDRIEKSEWKSFAAKMRGLGGGYSRYTGGFNFYFDPTETLEKEFSIDNSNPRSTESSTSIIYAIEKGKINKNSKHLHYIKNNIYDATLYHLGYDEPFPTHDNDPVDASSIVKEIEDKGYKSLYYNGKGEFTLNVHSNMRYNFKVKGVVELVKAEFKGLNEQNFYIPVNKKPQFGKDSYSWDKGNGFYKNNEEVKTDYKAGDKVLVTEYGYARAGEIIEAKNNPYTVSIGGFGEPAKKEIRNSLHYKLKFPDGIVDTFTSPERIIPYKDGIAMGFDFVSIDKRLTNFFIASRNDKVHPHHAWEKLISLPGTITYNEEKAQRARKSETKKEWRESVEKAKLKLKLLKQAWFNWELSSPVNFEFSRQITGETEEEQNHRLKIWAKNNKWGLNFLEKMEGERIKEKQPDISVDLEKDEKKNTSGQEIETSSEKDYSQSKELPKKSVDQHKENVKTDKKGTYNTPEPATQYINDHARNQAIEKRVDKIIEDHIEPSDDDREFLCQYSGSGGLQTQGATGKGIMTEYYTPIGAVQKMWDLAYMHGFKDGGSILENSVGIGRFLQFAPAESKIDAFEINRYSYLITKILFPEANVRNIPYEKNFVDENNLSIKDNVKPVYDLVIGNPPYGNFNSEYSDTEKKHTKAANLTEYFITRSLDQLKSGGLLVYIIGVAIENGGIPFLSSEKTQCKELIAKKTKLIDAYRLGNKIFKHTSVLADIVIFQKR